MHIPVHIQSLVCPLKGSAYIQLWIMNLHRMDRGQLGELLGVKSQWNWEYGM